MFGFKRKEKSQIPAPEQPSFNRQGSSSSIPNQRQGQGQPSDDLPQDRRYNRQAPSYNPKPVAGSYGNYGNYDPNQYSANRDELFRGARAPTARTGAGFDNGDSSQQRQPYPDEEGAEQQEGQQQEGNEEDDEVYVPSLAALVPLQS